jgi:hypothetical protein
MKAFGFSTSDTGDAFTFSSTTYKSSTERKFFPLKETEAATNVKKIQQKGLTERCTSL